MHLSAEECPHCGMQLEDLDVIYQNFERVVRRPHDAAGILRVQQRRQVSKWIAKAERAYPQLYFAVATASLSDEQHIRSYGFWLMNRGQFEDIPEGARADGCVLLVIDVNRKEVCLNFGYLLDYCVEEEAAFEALTGGHPYLIESNYMRAIEVMLGGTKRYVKKLRSIARKKQ
ncbi:hypothetical protein ACFPK9_13740 [Rubritalea spongiae]|uniref:TPM domain-containing protein n=1 Tax=Rubritalea spongiae TaxID=430797 RepID=A0ABW5E530_9BACT